MTSNLDARVLLRQGSITKGSMAARAPSVSKLTVTFVPRPGTAYSPAERATLKLRGLLPFKQETLAQQVDRALFQLRSIADPVMKNVYLHALKQRNETTFYKLTLTHFEESTLGFSFCAVCVWLLAALFACLTLSPS